MLPLKTILSPTNRLSEYDFQGFVGDRMVFSGSMIGVPIHRGQTSEPS